LNSSNDRRVYDGVSSRSNVFEPAPPQALSRPEDKLSAALSISRPEISITSNRSETSRLINHRPNTRFAFELNSSVARPTHNSKRKPNQQKTLTPLPEAFATIAFETTVNQPALSWSSFQEIQITTWQKN
jgi:hypothetical protein